MEAQRNMAIWYVDYIDGSETNIGTSFAQRTKSLNKATSLLTAGDIVRVMGASSSKANGSSSNGLITQSAALTQILNAADVRARSTGVRRSAKSPIRSSTQGSTSADRNGGSSFAQLAKHEGQPASKVRHAVRAGSRRRWRLIGTSPPKRDSNASRVEYWLDTKNNEVDCRFFLGKKQIAY
jgi:hypothetical protein